MPGKYPTIEVLATERQAIDPTSHPDGVQTGANLSKSETASLKLMFSRSPIYTTLAADYRVIAQKLLLGEPEVKQLGDEAQFPGGVDLDYGDSPNLSAGVAGFDSPYYPNLIVNEDPAGGEGSTGATPVPINDNFGSGDLVTAVIPFVTSAKLATTSIVVAGPVGASGQSAAHDVNPGALTTP